MTDVEAVADELWFEVDALYGGFGNPGALVTALHEAVLIVPTEGEHQLLTGAYGGMRWVYAFTSRQEMARFAAARDEADVEWTYLTVRGDRLVDGVLPTLPEPTGLIVDAAGDHPTPFPPGIGEGHA